MSSAYRTVAGVGKRREMSPVGLAGRWPSEDERLEVALVGVALKVRREAGRRAALEGAEGAPVEAFGALVAGRVVDDVDLDGLPPLHLHVAVRALEDPLRPRLGARLLVVQLLVPLVLLVVRQEVHHVPRGVRAEPAEEGRRGRRGGGGGVGDVSRRASAPHGVRARPVVRGAAAGVHVRGQEGPGRRVGRGGREHPPDALRGGRGRGRRARRWRRRRRRQALLEGILVLQTSQKVLGVAQGTFPRPGPLKRK